MHPWMKTSFQVMLCIHVTFSDALTILGSEEGQNSVTSFETCAQSLVSEYVQSFGFTLEKKPESFSSDSGIGTKTGTRTITTQLTEVSKLAISLSIL